ncbi:hypothetical protein EXS85_00975 [Helicobacter pylori]|nr:hypothetical protein [Helicobacter pylori]
MQNLFISLRKSFLQQNLQQIQRKNHYYKQTKNNQTKQSKLKPLFYHYPYSNNLISFKMTFIGLIFV